jgi:hypothetical protein
MEWCLFLRPLAAGRSSLYFFRWAAAWLTGAAFTYALPVMADEKPAGILPTTATLDQILTGYDKARARTRPSSVIEDGQVTAYGLKGTYHLVSSGDDFRERIRLGPIAYAYGELGGQEWEQNENGIVILEHDSHQENEIARSALTDHAKNGDRGLTLAGESESPPAYVIEVHAPGGRHEWQYFDKKTFELVRVDEMYPARRVVDTYDDYRTVDGFTHPWHIHRSDGYAQNDTDFVTSSMRYNVPVAASDLAIPQSNANLVQFPAGSQMVQIPARILDGRVIVTVTINGRNLDFELDSGSGGILLDWQVADQLGFAKFGRAISLAGRDFEASEALVPDLAVGSLHMHNVVVELASFVRPENPRASVVGLLGFDFFASAVVEVDYKDGQVYAEAPYLFVPPANAFALGATWDDGIPKVIASVGDVPANFVVDSGAFDNMLFLSFAQAHADVVKDQGGGLIMKQNNPFYYGRGVGGDMQLTPTQIKSFTLGPVTFQKYIMWELNDSAYNMEDYAGLIGQKFLSMFTVYFDYKDGQIYLIPTSKDIHPAL